MYKSTAVPSVWGFDNVISWVDSSDIAQTIELAESLVNIAEDERFAISVVYPSVFHKSLLAYVLNEVNIHIDLIIHEDDVVKTFKKFIDVMKEDFLQYTETLVPLQFKIVGAMCIELTAPEFIERYSDMEEPIKSATEIISTAMFKSGGLLTKVTKTFTLFRVWKKLGKLYCLSYGTIPLLNLYQGVLINSSSAELYESILFQSTFVDNEVILSKKNKHRDNSRSISMYLSKQHPSVLTQILSIRDNYLSTSHNLDLYRFTHGLILDCFLDSGDKHESLLQNIAHLHRSSSGKLYCLASRYEALAKYVRYTSENPKQVVPSLVFSLKNISKRLSNISNHVMYSVITKWYATCLENNIFILEELLHHEQQFQNLSTFLDVEKVSCFVASLMFQPFALLNLEHLSEKVNAYPDNLSVIEDHISLNIQFSGSFHQELPAPDFDIGLYDPSAYKSFHYGIDISRNAAKIQSAANMHTVAVLLQYQSDMYIDLTIENSIASVSTDFPTNPYNCMIKNCLSSFYKVELDSLPEASLSKAMIQKPKLKNQEHQIYTTSDNIFGLHHTLLQGDPEGIVLLLNICKTAQNKPYITKKDGIRIMHAMYPCADHLVCGKFDPMIYKVSCEELYVMIKETKSANADSAIAFLSEMLILHLNDISNNHIVVGYCVDKGNIILLNMNKIQSNISEKTALVSEFQSILEARSLLSFEFFIKISQGYYIKVIKDIKPIYADPSVELYDHYTPSSPLNTNFAVFYKHYTATFFYDYAEGTNEEDIQFVIEQLNQKILENKESWSVYKTILLKYMLLENTSFQITAFHAAHSACSKLYGLQQLNSILSELTDKSLTTGKNLDENVVKDMVIDLVVHCNEILQEICISDPLIEYIKVYLVAMYRSGEPVIDDLENLLKSLFIAVSSLAQYFEKEYLNSSSYNFEKFIAEATSQI